MKESVDAREGWDERLLRPAAEGMWIERRNLGLADCREEARYPCRLSVAINWDGSIESAGRGLAVVEEAVVAALTRDGLSVYVLAFLCGDEWDLVFHTSSAAQALAVVKALERDLASVTLIPEVEPDPEWSYYRYRLAAPGIETSSPTKAR